MTRAERRTEKKKYGKDFASFCRIMKLYFPDFISWLAGLKDPRKFWTYETEVMLMTVIMKNVCCIDSMQQMTDEFIKDECVKNLCTVLGVPEHEFLPHYVTINEFLSKMDEGELEKLRSRMIHALLRRRKFEQARLLGEYWTVIFDATGLFHFKERHCPHCLKKVLNKGTKDERTVYYHHVLEAKLVLGDGFVISIGTEFIENENEDVSKNDCETKAFKRLAEKLKKDYPRLKICVLADSLYASEPVFEKCTKDNGWHFLIRYKDGSIPSVAEEYRSIRSFGGSDSLEGTIAREYPRKGKVNKKLHMEWVPEIDYREYSLTLLALEIKETEERSGKTKTFVFQWLTDLTITHRNADEFADAGRGRWYIENQGFNIQKNIRYDIQHANSMDYNAMKCHYLLTQIADILMQLYENGRPGIREAKKRIKNISSDLLESFGELITGEDISFMSAYGYIKNT